MGPVIDHLKHKERLSVAQVEVLVTLIKNLSRVENLPQLDSIANLDVAAAASRL